MMTLHFATAVLLGTITTEPPRRFGDTTIRDTTIREKFTGMQLPTIPRRGGTIVDTAALVKDATRDGEEWSLRVERDGVRVWQRSLPGSRLAEIRGNAILRAPPRRVVAIMRRSDEETIRSYNPTYDSGHDLQVIDANTKVTYGAARRIFPFKPRDTVTRIAFHELPPAQLDSVGGSALLLATRRRR